MTLLLWFSLSVSGISGQGKTLDDGKGVGNVLLAFEDALQMVRFSLDATLTVMVAAFAPFAALFFLLAATLIASGRGFAQLAQPGRFAAAATWVPFGRQQSLPGCCRGCFQSPGWMLAATCRDFFKRVLLMAATMIAAIEGCVCEPGSEYTRLLVVFELVLPRLAGAGMENEFHFTVSETSGPVAGAGAENELQFNASETTGTRLEL